MSMNYWKAGAALFCVPLVLFLAGCSYCKADQPKTVTAPPPRPAPEVRVVERDLPPNAKPGECYAKVFVPEQFETQKETICVREASERLETIPPQYEWVEEQVVVKPASVRLEEVPAVFENRKQTVLVNAGHTGWQVEKTVRCVGDKNVNMAEEMYCLKRQEPVYQTIDTVVQVKPVTTREIPIPAEYQTVRRQKLVAPASTRRVAIPAEYATVDKIIKVADSRVEWQRVECVPERRAEDSTPPREVRTVAGH